MLAKIQLQQKSKSTICSAKSTVFKIKKNKQKNGNDKLFLYVWILCFGFINLGIFGMLLLKFDQFIIYSTAMVIFVLFFTVIFKNKIGSVCMSIHHV